MSFMISLFGSEQTGKPKFKRRISVGKGNVIGDSDDFSSSSAAGFSNETKRKEGKAAKTRGKQQKQQKKTMASDDEKSKRTFNRQQASLSSLPPEDNEGNVEYKLKLVDPSPGRFQHLVTQMKWRLREGQGEAIYEIGVEDDGVCAGLTDREMDASVTTLRRMAAELGASVNILRERDVSDSSVRRRVAEVLIRKVPDNQQFIDLRVAVMGSADAGKSTLLGVLTQGEMDNGRGKSRLNLFRHLHEVQTGRTSSICIDVMGFDSEGRILNYRNHSLEEICDLSTKLITFIDLAGHHKYMKTTMIGLSGYKPHFVALVVAANTGIECGTTKEHLAWANALQVPLFVIVTKIDITPPWTVERTLNALQSILKQPTYVKIPVVVRNEDDALTAAGSFSQGRVVPIFTLSSVTGENLDHLQKFLNVLPRSQTQYERDAQLQEDPLFEIDEIFNVSNVGAVCYGLLSKGIIREGDELLVGPDACGGFKPVVVDSLQRNRTQCRLIQSGQAASLAIGEFNALQLRKGLVMINPRSTRPALASMSFEADVYILQHPARYIAENFQTTVHIGNVCQTAIIARIGTPTRSAKQGDSANVTFVFLRQPEFVAVGSRLLFREGRTKGIGEVTRIGVEPPSLIIYGRRTVTG